MDSTLIDKLLLLLLALLLGAVVMAGQYSDCEENCTEQLDDCRDVCHDLYCPGACNPGYGPCIAACNVNQSVCLTACSVIDEDGDGIADVNDSVIGDQDDVTLEGLSGLEVTVGAFLSNESGASEVTGVQDVVFTAQGGPVLEFQNDFSSSHVSLSDVTIKRQTAAKMQGIVVHGLNVMDKTIYLDKLGEDGAVCVKDAEINDITEISRDCTGVNEIFFGRCEDGETIGRYTCEVENNKYKISGLRYSGVAEMNITGLFTGYFTVQYMNRARDHRDGYIMQGESVTVCFESAHPVEVEEHVRLTFQPRYGGFTHNEMYMPDVMQTYNVHLYP